METGSNDVKIPARFGLGTSGMGESAERADAEVAAINFALELGYRVIDTAEMYGQGGAEKLVGNALRNFGEQRRSEVFVMSKVYPENASRSGTIKACEASLERLGCGYIDLYLLHWRGPHEFKETLQAFDELQGRKLIRSFGVSNFDIDDLPEWRREERRLGMRSHAVANEISYRLDRRGIEYGQLEWHRAHGIQTIGYGPLGQGELASHPLLQELGAKRGVSAAQIALAWCLRLPDLISIPKSTKPERIKENYQALTMTLTEDELRQIDQVFPLKHRWLKGNAVLRYARSTARRIMRNVKPPASRTAKEGSDGHH